MAAGFLPRHAASLVVAMQDQCCIAGRRYICQRVLPRLVLMPAGRALHENLEDSRSDAEMVGGKTLTFKEF
jgi:hypothetical protein